MMEPLGAFTQEKLNEIWDSLDGNDPHPSAKKEVDDEAEQVMSINTTEGQVLVSRKPGEDWADMPSLRGVSADQNPRLFAAVPF